MLLVCGLLAACHEGEDGPGQSRYANRTVIAYQVAENNLETHLLTNVEMMVRGLAGLDSPCRLLVYWDGRSGTPKLSQYTVDGKGGASGEVVLKTYEEQNSLDPEVMRGVFSDIFAFAPSSSYGLVMSSHATGWLPPDTHTRSFGQDGTGKMDIPLLAQVLSDVTDKPFDYILFDACLMADVEVMYELRHTADYIIASPAEVIGAGFPYDRLMAYLYSDEVADYTLALPRAYIDYYAAYAYPWGTVSVVRCDEMDGLAREVGGILAAHADKLSQLDVRSLQRYDRQAIGFTYSAVDLKDFVETLSGSDGLDGFSTQLGRTVVFSDMVDGNLLFDLSRENYSGLGIYVPQADKPLWNAYFKTLAWYQAVGWESVLLRAGLYE